MKAVVKERAGPGNIALREWPEPKPGPDEVKIAVHAAGICGTDIHILDGEWPCNPPVVLGHEFCGAVTDVGAAVSGFKVGDRVVASNPARTCGMCHHCLAGNPFMCAKRVSAGYMIDGAFADYICITERRCHHLPENVSYRQAALGEPLSVAVHGLIERTSVRAGDIVLISGPGCVGILSMLIAKLHGAQTIVVGVAKDARRLALAKQLGADMVLDASQKGLADVLRGHCGNEGPDLVCECSGAPSALSLSLQSLRKGGTLLQLGIYSRSFEVEFDKLAMKELSAIGSFGYTWTSWQRSLKLLSIGKLNAEQLISHELPLSAYDDAFRLTKDGTATKVVFQPQMN